MALLYIEMVLDSQHIFNIPLQSSSANGITAIVYRAIKSLVLDTLSKDYVLAPM